MGKDLERFKWNAFENLTWTDFMGMDQKVALRFAINFMLRDWFEIRLNYYLDMDINDFPLDAAEKDLPMFKEYLKYYNQFIVQQNDGAFDAQLRRIELRIDYLKEEDMYKIIYRNRR
ncbi:hypothetical protein COK43_10345 [Bacillus cereus]|nr:hypothetical protein COK43_10345 [Bacillus cereus]PGQ80473.1 hypothetical protein COA15_19895 [Bacillus anthracis]